MDLESGSAGGRGTGMTRLAALTATALVLGGVLATVAGSLSPTGRVSDGLTWTVYMVAFAFAFALLGLIFAVPRARVDFNPGPSERYFGNSNLEQISDWLTKLLVGATLVSLGGLPAKLTTLGDYFGAGLSVPNPSAYAVSAVMYGAGVGFGSGYLWTRLKFRSLLELSDRQAADLSKATKIARKLRVAPGAEGESGSLVSRVAQDAVIRASSANLSEVLPVLWVDDHPENNVAIADAFRQLGIRVDISVTTGDALSRISTTDYAVVISDLGRVEGGVDRPMAGLDLIQEIQNLQVPTPVVIFAGSRGVDERSALVAAGARLVTQRATEVFAEVVKYVTGM